LPSPVVTDVDDSHFSTPNSKRSRRRRKNRKSKVEPILKQQKHHDAPMTKNDLYFALDCEMVGVGPDGLHSAVARVSLLNWEHQIVLDTFVQVPVPVTDFRTHISGIYPHDIHSERALPFQEVRMMVEGIVRGKILIGHGLENDLCALQLNHPWCDIRDTACYPPLMREVVVDYNSHETQFFPRKLRDLAWEKLGRLIQEENRPHCPLEDASAALDLYKESRVEWEQELSRIQANSYPFGYHQRKVGYGNSSSLSSPLSLTFQSTSLPFQQAFNAEQYEAQYEMQHPLCALQSSETTTVASLLPVTHEGKPPISRRWFRVKSPEPTKLLEKWDQGNTDNNAAAAAAATVRSTSPRTTSLFSFSRNMITRRAPTITTSCTLSTVESALDTVNEPFDPAWMAEYESLPENFVWLPDSESHRSGDFEFSSISVDDRNSDSGPLRSRLSTYLSIEAELGEDDVQVDKYAQESQIERSRDDWQGLHWSSYILPSIRGSFNM
jgi:RNA exonuclease 4